MRCHCGGQLIGCEDGRHFACRVCGNVISLELDHERTIEIHINLNGPREGVIDLTDAIAVKRSPRKLH